MLVRMRDHFKTQEKTQVIGLPSQSNTANIVSMKNVENGQADTANRTGYCGSLKAFFYALLNRGFEGVLTDTT